MTPESYKQDEPSRQQIDTALRVACSGVVAYGQSLMQAALLAGGLDLVQKCEAALRAGGVPMLRVGFLPGGAEVVLTIEGPQRVEIFDASGTLPTRGHEAGSRLQ